MDRSTSAGQEEDSHRLSIAISVSIRPIVDGGGCLFAVSGSGTRFMSDLTYHDAETGGAG